MCVRLYLFCCGVVLASFAAVVVLTSFSLGGVVWPLWAVWCHTSFPLVVLRCGVLCAYLFCFLSASLCLSVAVVCCGAAVWCWLG